MTLTVNQFPAKLLLFGEYSILLGSSALSMPFQKFHASLKFPGTAPTEPLITPIEPGILPGKGGQPAILFRNPAESNHLLSEFYQFLEAHADGFDDILDLDRFWMDISRGMYLESTIPGSYGMGSSGALCAAVYHRYCRKVEPPRVTQTRNGGLSRDVFPDSVPLGSLRLLFSKMESWFHGRSSGFDPLVSYSKTPLLLDKNLAVKPVEFKVSETSGDLIHVLLIDTETQGNTGPLVSDFLRNFAPEGITTPAGNELVALTDNAIAAWLAGNRESAWNAICQLSLFQIRELKHLVPDHLRIPWSEGLQKGLFSLKLCGSGGGGFLLCFTRNAEAGSLYFTRRRIPSMLV